MVQYVNDEMKRINKPLTAYKKFTKGLLDHFWSQYKEEIPKHERLKVYGIVKRILWDKLKSFVYADLGLNILKVRNNEMKSRNNLVSRPYSMDVSRKWSRRAVINIMVPSMRPSTIIYLQTFHAGKVPYLKDIKQPKIFLLR